MDLHDKIIFTFLIAAFIGTISTGCYVIASRVHKENQVYACSDAVNEKQLDLRERRRRHHHHHPERDEKPLNVREIPACSYLFDKKGMK